MIEVTFDTRLIETHSLNGFNLIAHKNVPNCVDKLSGYMLSSKYESRRIDSNLDRFWILDANTNLLFAYQLLIMLQ